MEATIKVKDLDDGVSIEVNYGKEGFNKDSRSHKLAEYGFKNMKSFEKRCNNRLSISDFETYLKIKDDIAERCEYILSEVEQDGNSELYMTDIGRKGDKVIIYFKECIGDRTIRYGSIEVPLNMFLSISTFTFNFK